MLDASSFSGTEARPLQILVDVDGVIADLSTPWYARYNRDYDDNLSPDRVTDWALHKFVRPECGMKVYDYLEDPTLYDECPVIEGALNGVDTMRSFGARVEFITSCSGPEMAKAKINWLLRNGFLATAAPPGTRFEPMEFINLIHSRNKHRYAADLMIDDYHENFNGFSGAKILFDAPYNRMSTLPRARGWNEVLRTPIAVAGQTSDNVVRAAWRTVTEGCAAHPAYRAKRAPKSYCTRCDEVYNAKQQILHLI